MHLSLQPNFIEVPCDSPQNVILVFSNLELFDWLYHSLTSTSTPKGSYRAKTGDNDCNINSSRYSLRTALCESIRYQAKSEQNVRQDLIPMVRHGEAALMHPEILKGK